MLNRDQSASIFDTLRKLTTADEIELLISSGRSALTRFANNTIHQNVAEEENHISVRVSFGGRHGARRPPTSTMTRACAAWCSPPKRWPACSRTIPTCCPCRRRRRSSETPRRPERVPVQPILRQHSSPDRRRPRRRRGADGERREEALAHRGRHLLDRRGRRGHLQLARRRRLVRADTGRSFDHDDRRYVVGLAEGQFAGRDAARSRAAGGDCCAESDRFAKSARACRRGSTRSSSSRLRCWTPSASCSGTSAARRCWSSDRS